MGVSVANCIKQVHHHRDGGEKKVNLEQLAALLEGFIFYGIIYLMLLVLFSLLKQRYLRGLCKFGGTKEKPGRACVVCSYNHQCHRARESQELKNYYYWRKMIPEKGKAIYDEIWEEEHKLALKDQRNSLTPFIGERRKK